MSTLIFDIDELIGRAQIETELELEQSLNAHKRLGFLIKENPSLKKKYKSLSRLISDYEYRNWSMESKTNKSQMEESDEAELIVEQEEHFIDQRKRLIMMRLSKLNLNQQEFGVILGHRSKSYISELMNGVKPFSLKDLIVISKLLKLNLNDLVFRSISEKDKQNILKTIQKLDKPKLKLDIKEFAFG